ncbi:hypothetical protein GCM10025860_24850 [Methanobacterium ferruginis]|nr:hypothetical protein GCM10025860_24850 [Methanobacterium ferruginis]
MIQINIIRFTGSIRTDQHMGSNRVNQFTGFTRIDQSMDYTRTDHLVTGGNLIDHP